jgi:ribose transport system substrate-binding protein
MSKSLLKYALSASLGAALCVVSGGALAGPFKVVSGPSADPQCFAPWAENTKFLQWE